MSESAGGAGVLVRYVLWPEMEVEDGEAGA
jgi:hypothetical protein